MTPTLDLLYVVLFTIATPLLDYLVFWPAFRRRLQADPAAARQWLSAWSIGTAWPIVALGIWLWTRSGRSWAELGFAAPEGWRLWAAIAFLALTAVYYALAIWSVVTNADTRAKLQPQLQQLDDVLPHSRSELYWFGGIAITAGFCEEFLFRGYFIWAFAPWLGWWGAAAVSLVCFALGHIYQGWGGVMRTAIFGAVFTAVYAVFGSLWPAIVLHVLVDLANGVMGWVVVREPRRAETLVT